MLAASLPEEPSNQVLQPGWSTVSIITLTVVGVVVGVALLVSLIYFRLFRCPRESLLSGISVANGATLDPLP